MKNNQKTTPFFLIFTAMTSFILMFMFLYYNGITCDDFGACSKLENMSIFHYVKDHYFTWMGNYMPLFFQGIYCTVTNFFSSSFPIMFTQYLVEIFLVKESISILLNLNQRKSWLYSICFFNIYIFTMFEITSYFWMMASEYTLFVVIFFHAGSLILKTKNYSLITMIIVTFEMICIGSSNAVMAPLSLFIFFCFICYKFLLKKPLNNKLFVFFCILLVAFIIFLIAPGNYNRLDLFNSTRPTSVLNFVAINISSLITLFKHLIINSIYLLLFIGIMLPIIPKKGVKTSFKNIFLYTLYYLIIIELSTALYTFAAGTTQSGRTLNHMILFTFIYLSLVMYELKPLLNLKFLSNLNVLCFFFLLASNIYSFTFTYPEVKEYRANENLRVYNLTKLKDKNNDRLVILKTYTSAKFHSFSDVWKILIPSISTKHIYMQTYMIDDPNYYWNKSYCEYYNLPFGIIDVTHHEVGL